MKLKIKNLIEKINSRPCEYKKGFMKTKIHDAGDNLSLGKILNLQGIIQKKLASGSRMLPLVIFDKKVPFFPKIVLF